MAELAKTHPPNPAQEIALYLKNRTAQIKASLPDNYPGGVERFIQVANACMLRNPALSQTSPTSFYSAVQWLAEMGLEPGRADQLAYLVPYGSECAPQVGYRGMIKLAYDSGVKSIDAVIVREADTFEQVEGLHPDLIHKFPKLGTPRGEMIGVYARAKLPSGETISVVMDKAEVEKHRARSLAAKSTKETINMWRDFPESAWKKTAIRELYKFLPNNHKLAEAAARDIDGGAKVTDVQVATIEDLAALPSKSEILSEKVAGDRAAMDAEVMAENHDLDEILRCCREAQSPLELSGPKNMLSRLTNANDKKLAEKAIADRETEFGRRK